MGMAPQERTNQQSAHGAEFLAGPVQNAVVVLYFRNGHLFYVEEQNHRLIHRPAVPAFIYSAGIWDTGNCAAAGVYGTTDTRI